MTRDSKRLRYLSFLLSCLLVVTMIVGVTAFLRSSKVFSETRGTSSEQNTVLREVPQLIHNTKSAGAKFRRHELFQHQTARAADDATLRKAVTEGTVLQLHGENLRRILTEDMPFLILPLPDGKGGSVELELVKVNIFARGFTVNAASSADKDISRELGAHYRGIIKGDNASLAAISIFENEVMGFYATPAEGNMVLGRLQGDNPGNRHILYADKNLKTKPDYGCETEDPKEALPTSAPTDSQTERALARCIRIYLEADYDLYLNKGSLLNVKNYLTGMFNQSATLYSNDGIAISLSQIFIWDVPSPYTGTNTSGALLPLFRTTRTAFNGDLAHLVALRGGGGVAYINSMCSSFRYAFSGINASFQTVPTYSWTVDVFSHETGHNVISPHTHACSWNGNGTAIDGCWTTEGGCPSPAIPAEGGTIMSYCHLQSVGKNFTFGFGPQPKERMVNRFNAVTCLSDCAFLSGNKAAFDFDGDGRSDVSVFRPAAGEWHVLNSGSGYTGALFGTSGDIQAPADYDGDGRTDLAVFRPSTGEWYILRSTLGFTSATFGRTADAPMVGDFDGDGKADISLFRSADATWYRINSSNGQFVAVQFGLHDDDPAIGDYDGDGRMDIAVYRHSNAVWYLLRSTMGFTAAQFGSPTDIPVPGDYDADGRTDLAVFRWAAGDTAWYIQRSSLGFTTTFFGATLDIPVPADYDGDGRTDVAIFRQSNATWYLLRSTAGITGIQFGVSTDKPIPSSYLMN